MIKSDNFSSSLSALISEYLKITSLSESSFFFDVLLSASRQRGGQISTISQEWQRFVRRHFEYDLSRERSRTLKVRDAFQMLEQKNSEDVLQLGPDW